MDVKTRRAHNKRDNPSHPYGYRLSEAGQLRAGSCTTEVDLLVASAL